MRSFLVSLIFAPIAVFAATFAWVVHSQPKETDIIIEIPSVGKPPETEDSKVIKGWEVYTSKGCVYCHGPEGGGGVNNSNAKGGLIPALNKVYEGYSEDELKEKILDGVMVIGKDDPAKPTPPLHMPSWRGSLSSEELDAVVAYLMSFEPEGGGDDDW